MVVVVAVVVVVVSRALEVHVRRAAAEHAPGAAPARRPTDDGVDARIGSGAMSFGAGGAAGLSSDSDAGLISPFGSAPPPSACPSASY